ncbi:MAG: DUF5309 domain-containing protein [Helicobacteraceae bacterium]|jgi:hypothetical protein|nr:DUF5309 domain-containing protein [Helicobacteraceae bacterium]
MELSSLTQPERLQILNQLQYVGQKDTPLFSTLQSYMLPRDEKANPKDGIAWDYINIPSAGDNAALEGDDYPAAEAYPTLRGHNHFQIIRSPFGVTGSEEAVSDSAGKKMLAQQAAIAKIKHGKDIDFALHGTAAPSPRGAAVAGKMGGIRSFVTPQTTVNAASAPLEWELLRELLKSSFVGGSPLTDLYMSTRQKDKIDDITFNKADAKLETKKISNNVTMLGDTAYGSNITIHLDPLIPDDVILGINKGLCGLLSHRETHIQEEGKKGDRVKQLYYTELTCFVLSRYAVAEIQNLAV